ncbi:MAG: glucohydrolase, partial [Lachnospiraceae bacterium]|nr:glucohydrolase [Lachnospiraceae bacterium]
MDYLIARGRDNSRTPMQWNSDLYAGFSTITPWINVNPNYVDINAQQIKKPKSIFNYYREMIRLRRSSQYNKTLTYGDFRSIVTKEDNL